MQFNYRYAGSTAIAGSPQSTSMTFAPDTYREPTFFVGTLGKRLPFREAISALHHVVVSDLRVKPKDRTQYMEWLRQQEQVFVADVLEQHAGLTKQIGGIRSEIRALREEQSRVMAPFYKAQRKYFNFLYKRHHDLWFVLDPVITVHPDEIFFECFSQDESSYGRLGCSYEVFSDISEFACGTTNIDYSAALYNEFQKIRTYKETQFTVDPSGFEVETQGEEMYKEVKIDLPDSWVRGFLQVSSAMTLPARRLELHPMDVYNLCFVLRQNKARHGPRSMRYHLTPGEPIRIVFEPWNREVVCARSIYRGHEPDEIRVWGRRRLLILERLIPVAQRFTIHLLGTGMPSFYVADLGAMNFTLGLSGWTSNDWSRLGQFDLMAPRAEVDIFTKQQVFDGLRETWQATPDALATRLGLDRSTILGALSAYTQAGRAIYDLNKDVYRVRELSREPLPLDRLRFANEREAAATRFLDARAVKAKARHDTGGQLRLSGSVKDGDKKYAPTLTIDGDERMTEAQCTCSHYVRNKLYKGPCEHMLALRMAHAQTKQPTLPVN